MQIKANAETESERIYSLSHLTKYSLTSIDAAGKIDIIRLHFLITHIHLEHSKKPLREIAVRVRLIIPINKSVESR
jgi:hypothetical protein